jgi:hypothetical protein
MTPQAEIPRTDMTYTGPPVNPTTNGGSAELPAEEGEDRTEGAGERRSDVEDR